MKKLYCFIFLVILNLLLFLKVEGVSAADPSVSFDLYTSMPTTVVDSGHTRLTGIGPDQDVYVKVYANDVVNLSNWKINVSFDKTKLRWERINTSYGYLIKNESTGEKNILNKNTNDSLVIDPSLTSSTYFYTDSSLKFSALLLSNGLPPSDAIAPDGSGLLCIFRLKTTSTFNTGDSAIIQLTSMGEGYNQFLDNSGNLIPKVPTSGKGVLLLINQNRPPVLAFTDSTVTGNVGRALSFQVAATDPDPNSTITFSFTGTPPAGVTTSTAGLISGTPTEGGSFSLQVIASDGIGGLDTGTVRLSINRIPVLAFSDTSISGSVGTALSFQIMATDADNDSISYTFTGTSPTGVMTTATGLISGTPTDTGSFTLQVIGSDRKGGLDTGTVRLSIRLANHPPVLAFTDTTISGVTGTALSFHVMATDADNDSISYTFTGTSPTGVTTTATGLISGTPTDTGSFTLQVIGSDRKGGLDTGTVRLSIRSSVTPSISTYLPSGWNLISSNVINTSTRVDSIFSAIVSKVEILKNILGRVYWPRFSVNQIGNWVITEGYWVYMKSADTLKMRGQQANPSTPISLAAGWSIISYLPNAPMSPVRACSTISDKIVIMKDAVGKVYWPRFSVDQIGTMQVGKGYLIYLSSAGTMIYPSILAKEGNNILIENKNRDQLNPQHFAYVRRTGATATIMVRMNEKPVINSTALEIGDEIGIFTPEGLCAGAGVWNGDNVLITAWGDNGETASIDGFKDGQTYNFKLWDKSADIEKEISVIAESGNLSYSENGITVIASEQTTALPENFVLRQNYPNPFNPSTRIDYQIKTQSQVTLSIYNIAGQLIRILVKSSQPAGVHSIEWDGKNSSGVQVTSGIYLYRLQAGSFVETRKMVLMK